MMGDNDDDDATSTGCRNRPEESYHAQFDCLSGAAGDMMLAACLDSVVDEATSDEQ